MDRVGLNTRDRGRAWFAAVCFQAVLLLAFLNISAGINLDPDQRALRLVDVAPLPPPPVPVQHRKQRQHSREAAAAPRNVRSEAAAVVVPVPLIKLPVVQQVTVATVARQGADPTQGAADRQGPGTGAGGEGSGTGTGGSGSGSGSGGDVFEPPHLATPVLRGRDFPRDMLEQWPRAATIFLRLRVDARGFIAECLVDRGTAVPEIDSAMCNTAHERLRFRPALNSSGQAVAGWFGYAQPAPR